MTDESGVAWVVACLAPWAISPHRNFRSDSTPGPAAQLALVVEARSEEIATYTAAPAGTTPDDPLVAAALASTVLDSQPAALETLLGLTAEVAAPLGARVAAALFGLLAASELDRSGEALDAVSETLQLADLPDPTDAEPSVRLCWSAVLLQCAFRAEETHHPSLAEQYLVAAERWVRRGGSSFEEFAVSRGIGWNAQRVQRDVMEVLRRRAQRMRVRLEFPGGRTWERAVRSRGGWVDYRLADLSRWVFERKAEDAFATRVAGLRVARTVRFGSETQREYELVLLAELGADRDLSRRARAAQAWRLLERGDLPSAEPWSVQMALRLLRQSGEERQLRDAVELVRVGGPLGGLLNDARAVLKRANAGGFIASEDLLVLAGAADLFEVGEAGRALDAVLAFVPRQRQRERLQWSALSETWKAVARFAPVAERDEDIAAAAIAQLAEETVLSNTVVVQSILSAVRSLDWGLVEEGTRRRWDGWAAAPLGEDLQLFQAEVAGFRGGAAAALVPAESLAAAVSLVNVKEDTDVDEDRVEAAGRAVSAALQQDLENAATGVTAFGGYDAGEVAAAFAQRFDPPPLWDLLGQYLVEPRLSGRLKVAALERLAQRPTRTPETVRRQLGEVADVLLQQRDGDPFLHPGLSRGNPPALRALAAHGLLELSTVRAAVYEFLQQGELGRLEAARSLPFCSQVGGAEWSGTLLFALAVDTSPQVVAQAGFGLALRVPDDDSAELAEAVRRALSGPGVLAPLQILHALQRLKDEGASLPGWLLAEVARIEAGVTTAGVVRRTAADLLEGRANTVG